MSAGSGVTSRGRPWPFWAGLAAGWAIMAIGVRGLIVNAARSHPESWVVWFAGSAIAHDALFAPAVCAAGWAVSRVVPARVRAAVQTALIMSGVFVVVGFPLVRGYGVRPNDPSHLPRNYGAGLALLLGGVWVAAALVVGVRVLLERVRSRTDGPR